MQCGGKVGYLTDERTDTNYWYMPVEMFRYQIFLLLLNLLEQRFIPIPICFNSSLLAQTGELIHYSAVPWHAQFF